MPGYIVKIISPDVVLLVISDVLDDCSIFKIFEEPKLLLTVGNVLKYATI